MTRLAMVSVGSAPVSGNRDYGRKAEDVALVLSLVIAVVLTMTLVSIVILEFFEILPGGIDTIALMCLVVFCGVVGWAILSRALATPTIYRGHTPIVRHPNH